MFSFLKNFSKKDGSRRKFGDSGTAFNYISGLGSSDDKTNKTYFTVNQFYQNRSMLENIYVNSWAAKKFVDIPVDDMFLIPRTFKDFDDKAEDAFKKVFKELKIDKKVANTIKAARTYGSALLVIISEDAPLNTPLNLDTFGMGDLKNILVVDRFYASVLTRCTDITDPNFGFPNCYLVNFLYKPGIEIHHSRVIRIDGIEFMTDNKWMNYIIDWGISNLVNCIDTIQDEVSTMSATSQLMQEASIPVIKFQNLDDALSGAPDARTNIDQLVSNINRYKSVYRTVYLDKNSDMTRLDVNLRQVPEVIDRNWMRLCAAFDIPQTRFLGSSPQGMNATGDSDLKNYAMMVMAKQNTLLKDAFHTLDKIVAKHIGYEKDIVFEFPALIEISDTEKATMKLQNAQADQIYITNGVISEEEVRQNLSNTDAYSIDINEPMDNSGAAQEAVNALAQKMQASQTEVGKTNEPTTQVNPAGKTSQKR